MNRCTVGFHKYVKIDEHISVYDIMKKVVSAFDPVLHGQIIECITDKYNVLQPEFLSIHHPGRKVCIKCGKIKNNILKEAQKMVKVIKKKKLLRTKQYLKKCEAKKIFLLSLLKTTEKGSVLEAKIKERINELTTTINNIINENSTVQKGQQKMRETINL